MVYDIDPYCTNHQDAGTPFLTSSEHLWDLRMSYIWGSGLLETKAWLTIQARRPFCSQHVNILRSTRYVHLEAVVGLRRLRLLLFSILSLSFSLSRSPRLLLNFAAKYCNNSRDSRRGKKEHHDLETMEGMIHLWAFNAPPPPPPPIPHPTHITQKIKNNSQNFGEATYTYTWNTITQLYDMWWVSL